MTGAAATSQVQAPPTARAAMVAGCMLPLLLARLLVAVRVPSAVRVLTATCVCILVPAYCCTSGACVQCFLLQETNTGPSLADTGVTDICAGQGACSWQSTNGTVCSRQKCTPCPQYPAGAPAGPGDADSARGERSSREGMRVASSCKQAGR